jgi:murein DD-endopeptidase MepM/ murein hydrolase activator NlpD
VFVLVGVVAAPHAAVAYDTLPDTPDIAAAKGQVSSLQAQAREVARQLAAVVAEVKTLDKQIADLGLYFPLLERAEKHWRHVLTRRAVEMYMFHSAAEPRVALELLESPDLIAAVRTARLAHDAQTAEIEKIYWAQDLYQRVLTLQTALKAQRVEKLGEIQSLQHEQAEIDERTAAAAALVRRLEIEEAQRQYVLALQRIAEAEAAANAPPAELPPPPPAWENQSDIADGDAALLIPIADLICPVQGTVQFTNDWGNPRSGWRFHSGTDIFAPRGRPDVAVADGVARMTVSPKAGNSIWLDADHGVSYFYAHLDSWEGDWPGGSRRVTQGEVIGYVGNTGNAAGGPTHTHFQIHPGGGGAVNPYSTLLAICTDT